MAGVTETHFCRGISRLTGIDLLTEGASMANFGDRRSTLSAFSLLEPLYFFSLPGAPSHGCRVVHPGMFAGIGIDQIAFQLENCFASNGADERNLLPCQRRGGHQRFLPFDGPVVVPPHFLGSSLFPPLV